MTNCYTQYSIYNQLMSLPYLELKMLIANFCKLSGLSLESLYLAGNPAIFNNRIPVSCLPYLVSARKPTKYKKAGCSDIRCIPDKKLTCVNYQSIIHFNSNFLTRRSVGACLKRSIFYNRKCITPFLLPMGNHLFFP